MLCKCQGPCSSPSQPSESQSHPEPGQKAKSQAPAPDSNKDNWGESRRHLGWVFDLGK